MKVALWASNPKLGDVEANVKTVVDAVRRKDAQLVVFPEMFLSGYAIGDLAQSLALKPDDARLELIRKVVRETGIHVIAGGPFTPRAGITQNAALWFSSQGTTVYAKRCLPTFTTFQEGLFFTAGNESPVWDIGGVKVGVHICYDLFFPEHQRSQVLGGADVILNLAASPSPSRPFFETLLKARAVENASFVLFTNNCGAQDNLVFWGGARGIGPRGTDLGHLEPFQEGHIVVDLDLADLRPAREFRPTIRDGKTEDQQLEGHPIKTLGRQA